jgi:hypothetical protein
MASRLWGNGQGAARRVWRASATSSARHRRRSRIGRYRVLERLEDRTLLATAVWDGTGVLLDSQGNVIRTADGTSWEDNLNWVGDTLPAPGDDVMIPNVPATSVVRLSSGNWSINSLVSDEPFSFGGGTLDVNSTVQVNNTFAMNGGILENATVQPGSGGQGVSASGILRDLTMNAPLDVPTGGVLKIDGGMTLNSTAQLDGNGMSTVAGRLDFVSSQTLGGTGTVVLNYTPNGPLQFLSQLPAINVDGTTQLTIGSGITVRGNYGLIGGAYSTAGTDTIVNQGTISADVAQGTLTVQSQVFTNQATVQAKSGGSVALSSPNWSSTGTIRADGTLDSVHTTSVTLGGNFTLPSGHTFDLLGGGAIVQTGSLNNAGNTVTIDTSGGKGIYYLNGGTINGGTIAGPAGSTLDGSAHLVGTTLNIDLNPAGGNGPGYGIITVDGGLTLDGTLQLTGAGSSAFGSRMVFDSTGTLSGTGTVVFNYTANGPLQNLIQLPAINVDGTTQLTVGSGITVRGNYGLIGGAYSTAGIDTIVNQGTISADVASSTLTVTPKVFTNLGTLQAKNGGTLAINPVPTNFASGTLTGGSWQAFANSQVLLPSGTNITTSAASILLDGTGSMLETGMGTDALAQFATNAAASSFTIRNGRSFGAVGSFTNAGNVTIGAGSTFSAAGGGALQPPTDQVSWYPLDSSANDSTGSNSPNATSAISFVPARIGNGVTFGTNGYIQIPDNGSLDNQHITVDAWVKPNGPGPNNDSFGSAIVNKNYDSVNSSLYMGWRSSDDRFVVDVGQAANEIASTDVFVPGQFYHVAAVYDGAQELLYVNGSLEGRVTLNTTLPYTTSTPWMIGSNPTIYFGVGFPRTFNGTIDDVRVYNRALSALEIQSSAGSGLYEQTGGATQVDGTLAATSQGTVEIDSGTLSGTGSIAGNIINAGQVNPGDSPGTLSISGNYTQTSAGALNIELAGSAAGQFDRLGVSGTATLDGTLAISLVSPFFPLPPASFRILTFGSRSGDFATETGTHLGGGLKLSPGYDSTGLTETTLPGPTTTSVASSAAPSVFGQSVTFTATISLQEPGPPNPTGNVQFFDGATLLGTSVLNGGSASFTSSALAVGSHSITATYEGDPYFTSSASTAFSQEVDQASTSTALSEDIDPSVFGQLVTFTAVVTAVPPGAGIPSGSVTFMDGASTLGAGTLDSGGTAIFSTASLSAAMHAIIAVYSGDSSFLTSTSAASSQVVNQASTSTALTADINPAVYGQAVTIAAAVSAVAPGSGIPSGTVTFEDGASTLGTAALDASGTAALSTSLLSVGTHSITAVYGGDSRFLPSTSALSSQVVNQANTSTALGASPNPSTYGSPVTLTATIAVVAPGAGNPTGSVEFFDGPTLIGTSGLIGTQATLTTSILAIGTHSLTAEYAGDGSFGASTSSTVSLTVSQSSNNGATTTSLSTSVNPSFYSQSVMFTAVVSAVTAGSGIPTGIVTFKDGTNTLGTRTLDTSGTATFSTASLSVGTHSIIASYGGDGIFTGSTSMSVSQTVAQDSTTSTMVSSANPSLLHQAISFTVTVVAAPPGSATPTGSVSFQIDGTAFGSAVTLVNGVATSGATSSLKVGSHTITASYSGDANFTRTTAPSLIQVVNPDNTSTSLTSSVNPSVHGQSVSFTASVMAIAPGTGTPGGSVAFYDGATKLGAVTLSKGLATYTAAVLPTGQNSITAVYSGSSTFATSTSAVLNETVNRDGTSAAITSAVNPSAFGQSVTFTATVKALSPGSGTPSGSVTFMEGSTPLGSAPLSSGKATFHTGSLVTGSHSITAVYNGDTNFTTSTSVAVTQSVQQDATTTKLSSSVNPSVFGQSVTLTATVTAGTPGSGTPTGSVTFLDGSTAIGSGTLGNTGMATFATSSLSVGTHKITAVFAGDGNFKSSTSAILKQVVNPSGATALAQPAVPPANQGIAALAELDDSGSRIEALALERLSVPGKMPVKVTRHERSTQ